MKKILLICANVLWAKKMIFETSKVIAKLKKKNDVQFIIKLHPDDPKEITRYAKECSKKFNIDTFIIKYINIYHLILGSDLIISYESSLGWDILMMHKPLLIINFSGEKPYLQYTLEKIVQIANKPTELYTLVHEYLNTTKLNYNKVNKFLNKYISPGNPQEKIVNEIKRGMK